MEQLTVKETAEMLKVSEKTVYRWIRQGVIPTVHTHGRYRFDRRELEKWARYKRIGSEKSGTEGTSNEDEKVDLLSALTLGGVHYGLTGTSTEHIFRNAIAQLPALQDLEEDIQETLIMEMLERESLVSTGVGNGIALPHPRHPRNWGLGAPVVAMFYLKKKLNFNAIDGKPVFLLTFVLCQTVKGHLNMLSRIAHVFNDQEMKDFLASNPKPNKVMERIENAQKAGTPRH